MQLAPPLPPIEDSSVCVALSNCKMVKADACCCSCCCNWIWWAIFHDGFMYNASREAVRRMPDDINAESAICCLLARKTRKRNFHMIPLPRSSFHNSNLWNNLQHPDYGDPNYCDLAKWDALAATWHYKNSNWPMQYGHFQRLKTNCCCHSTASATKTLGSSLSSVQLFASYLHPMACLEHCMLSSTFR